MEKELRYLPTEISSDGNTVTGLAIVYGSPSKPLPFSKGGGSFVEIIEPGAGADVIRGDTVALFEHKTENPLGRTGANLTLSESSRGISYSLTLPDTSLGKDIKELVSKGILRGASFYLDVPKGGDKWSRQNGTVYRNISKLNSLPEISLVMSPAYPDTSAALRSYEAFEAEQNAVLNLDDECLAETITKIRQLIVNRLKD